MLLPNICQAVTLALAFTQSSALVLGNGQHVTILQDKRAPLQDLVTWDAHSLFVRGERVLFWSGEFHPFRLPVPGLWLDIFQKIRSAGYNGVSFYTNWAQLEGKQGDFRADGIFALEPFFDAAQAAGIYLLARPGPYINAEVSGGGFPGWLQRNPAISRTRDPRFLNATTNYMDNILQIIAKAQITNGGPVILAQPENEYSQAVNIPEFPDPVYFQYVEDQFRRNGIVVPLISNDAGPYGNFAPGPSRKQAAVDIYGHDGYPLGFNCGNPYQWPANALPTNYGELHKNQSSSTPYSIVEFQGGSFDPWGGYGFGACTALLGPEFERVFYKNNVGFGLTIYNQYMIFGGTNWGNLGHPLGYTSYDYGAIIAEDRTVAREKYSQAKLLANFLFASPAYLTAQPHSNANAVGAFTGNQDLFVTALTGNSTKFFVVRHTEYESFATTSYSITLPTSRGNITVPQTGGSLSLHGRDSKIFVTDYDLGGINLLYSTAEIFTWHRYGSKRVLVVYSGPEETNEFAFAATSYASASVTEGDQSTIRISKNGGYAIVNFDTSSGRRVVKSGDLFIYILDRQSAYNHWVINNNAQHAPALIVNAGYLVRNATLNGKVLDLVGDSNSTSCIEIIGGAPAQLKQLTWNGKDLSFTQDQNGVVKATTEYIKPTLALPDLSTIQWRYIDSLPEIRSDYNDSPWTSASLTYTNNTARNLTTPTSLYGSDYGYHAGSLLYRGHFVARGDEKDIFLRTQGGNAFGHTVWLNSTCLGSYTGNPSYEDANTTYTLPTLHAGSSNVITILIDHMGLNENFRVGDPSAKNPRGILDYALSGRPKSAIIWKLTGNLGGEDYKDKIRGPLNEGSLFAERKGYHLPGAPISTWPSVVSGPIKGISKAGVAFYAADIPLNLPKGYDITLSLSFEDASTSGNFTSRPAYRSQIWVNGYQFGKYVHNIGPQVDYPVPPGIWNVRGTNRVAVSLWALEAGGARVKNFTLKAGPAILSGYGEVPLSPMGEWVERKGAY